RIARPRRWLLGLYVASALAVTLQQAVLHQSNNFRVFRSATINLLARRDLYAAHPEQHFDYYNYSPTFALLFAPLAYLPFALAFLCWTLLNALLLWYALERLLPQRQATLAIGLLYLEVLFAMQYGQSNALVAALMVLAFVALERGRQLEAAIEVGLGASIKLFPLALLPIVVCHPRRARFGLLFLGVATALVVLPLLAVPVPELVAQYRSWRAIEASDMLNRGYSLMQYLTMALGTEWPNWPVQLAGTALLVAPLALGRARWRDAAFRRLVLCSVLVYVVLFNHQPERATFVIASPRIVVPGGEIAVGVAGMDHELGGARLEAVQDGEQPRQEAAAPLQRDADEPVRPIERRCPARRHSPRHAQRRLFQRRAPVHRVDAPRLERHPEDGHARGARRLHHRAPHPGKDVHVAVTVEMGHDESGVAEPCELGGALDRDIPWIEPPGERARNQRPERVEPAGAGVGQVPAPRDRAAHGQIEVQSHTEPGGGTQVAQPPQRVGPARRVHQHGDR